MKLYRSKAGFTFVEAMISLSLSGLLAGMIYVIATESLTSFARNVSINRSYTDAHQTLDRIAQTVGTAAHTPVLIDANGATTASTPAAGIRFYRSLPQTNYKITLGSTGPYSANKSLTIQLAAGQTPPAAKDIAVIPTLGYQGTIASVVTSGTTAVLTFSNTLATDCTPALTSVVDLTTPTPYYIQTYTQVSYVVVANQYGIYQLRYYPSAKTLAGDGTAVFNNTNSYQVLVNLVSSAYNSGGTAVNPQLPFSIINSPTVQVQLYAANPEYNNRTSTGLTFVNASNTYTYMQCSLGARSPVLLRSPY